MQFLFIQSGLPSNFLFHGLLPPRSCCEPAPRALTLSGQTLCVWLTSLTAVGYFVPQVWDSASSRLRADFHRSAHIASVVQRKAPQSVCFAGLINPGSYLLSRDLSSDYHRRADVSLPGSEWVRVGPSGYDHQASVLTSFAGSSLLRNS